MGLQGEMSGWMGGHFVFLDLLEYNNHFPRLSDRAKMCLSLAHSCRIGNFQRSVCLFSKLSTGIEANACTKTWSPSG